MNENNSPPILPGLPASKGDPQIIALLENALASAKTGKIVGAAVILAHGPDALSLSSAGAFPATLIAGCHQMANQMLEGMFARRSPIIKARM